MSEWVSQAEAVKLLAALGDEVSQQALSQYLKGHGEVPRREGGPGRPTLIDWEALRTSRITRRSRGPAETPIADAPELAIEPAPAAAAATAPGNPFGERKARADIERAEADARRARILADEAEGLTVPRAVAIAAFAAAGVALNRTLEERRRGVIDAIRAAREPRDADLAMRAYERALRTAFASALTEMADDAARETFQAA